MNSEFNWQKSSFSGGGGEQCLYLAKHNGEILLCESDDPASIVTTSPEKLAAFIAGVKAGEFDHLVG
ncbi:DUF397 domain-containing protein [Streptomyces griseoviridis]|uniref:DUF397 domain-containing protein n=2 Tax=Streptomyces TaxID=1883 RepID=A0A3S9ZF29_STRGD|nr:MULTISPECIES: DUF397 domain-containing protein [Streptomyces]AZS86444.1 DUF397 domain-containing protein [Streptomyces griseoviridis]MDH6700125.1 hypothetical protein [Streptomyces sp. MAA16]MDT0476050.1 DUF397 domain-containing protein [Streptomyces sp. DSM 41014]QCN86693.1 DUF397 domain-containing protein [Streptomyces griseoviridis]